MRTTTRIASPVLVLVAMAGCKSDYQTATVHPTIAVLSKSIDFGAAVAGTEVFTQDLEIQNVGKATLNVDLDAPDDAAFTFAGAPHLELAIDESTTVTLSFAPTDLEDYASTLVIHSPDDPDHKEVDVPLTGTGRVPYAPDIDLSTTELDWPGSYASGSYDDLFLPLKISNVGDADLDLYSVLQDGAGVFAMDSDPSWVVLPPGGSKIVGVTYAPSPLLPDGASGTLTIPSNDPDEPEVQVALTGGAGGTGEYPTAVISHCNDDPNHPGHMHLDLIGSTELALDGVDSVDPLGQGLTYAWSVGYRPYGTDTTRTVDPSDQVAGTLLVDTAGHWEIGLQVTDALGIPSPMAKCVIDAVPVDTIHVELSWGGQLNDLDLHLSDGSALYDVPGDVSWCNPSPDWGVAGEPSDDGHLVLDATAGGGPEEVGVTVPADGTYPVRVHYFNDAGNEGSTTATVSVFLNDGSRDPTTPVWTGSQVLERNQVWEVGQVNWPDATFGTSGQVWDEEDLRECLE